MRLHHLSMTAFGPFAETVEVDFDELSAAGLFLLTGATGAGKTSVLDAVCFALYGQVPGDRAGAKHLRSDHAEAGLAPRVVLEVSIGERRFRFTRSPAWSRAKLRGHGETKVQAHVLVEERGADGWTGLTNRLDDAGLLVSDLLGMTCGQFTQVAMLPQGRFQAFLRASSSERHAVLQQLFRTDRFERVEKWLVERRGQARRAAEAGEAGVRGVLHRLEEAAAVTLPEELGANLSGAADDGTLLGWLEDVHAGADAAHESAVAARSEAEQHEAGTSEALREARGRHQLIERARTAVAELDELEQQAESHDELRGRLELHHRAVPLSALADRSRRSARAASAAAEACAARLAQLELGLLTGEPTRPELVDEVRAAQQRHAEAVAFLPREREVRTAEQRRDRLVADLDAVAGERAAAEDTLAALPAALAEAENCRERAAQAASALPGAAAEADRLAGLVAAASRYAVVSSDLGAGRLALLEATALAQQSREVYLDAREARINGMAAELAGALASGCSCPVCGSAEHPSPARGAAVPAGRAEEDQARRSHEDAAFLEQGHQVRVAGLEAELAALTEQLGADAGLHPAVLRERFDAARRSHEELAKIADDAAPATAAVNALRARLEAATTRVRELDVAAAAGQAELDALIATLGTLHQERAGLLGDGAPDVATLVAVRERAALAFEEALAAWDARDAARASAAETAEDLLRAATGAGFDTVDEALAALLDPAVAATGAEALAAAEARRLAAHQVLADPEIQAVSGLQPPDLAALTTTHDEAITVLRERAAVAAAAGTRASRIGELGTRLGEVLQTWAPLRSRHRVTAELASLVEGRSVDNPLRMRLAAYVLSERLRQVVAAANERLSRMTGERYALEHSEDRGVGELRGGLSLRVRDDWNGVHRDPATLSGGETFVVSLALALGLADTVAHEAGGTDIDTLFIDEGFGSLDPDTLEDVMDTLDALRDGGRVVGLVSHVPELRSRITTQLEVTKGRTGSTLRPVLVGG